MTTFVPLHDASAIERAEAALRAGHAIVLPTDTVYGVAALPQFVDLLSALKGRPDDMPIAVLVSSVEQARELVRFSGVAERLAAAFWPGPLTLVLPRADGGPTLGVRCPDHDFVRALAARVGPLSTTSANHHGRPTPDRAADAAEALTGAVDVVVDGGPCVGVASTVVDACGETVTILREGPITADRVRAVALT